MLFADLLSLHLVTFLMFFILVQVWVVVNDCYEPRSVFVDVFLPMESIFSTTVGIKLRFPFHLHKIHLERNFGVKITPS